MNYFKYKLSISYIRIFIFQDDASANKIDHTSQRKTTNSSYEIFEYYQKNNSCICGLTHHARPHSKKIY